MYINNLRIFAFITLLLLISSPASAQTPLGNSFTYQGQLKDGGGAVSGNYNFIFQLFDDADGGLQVGDEVIIDEWPVSEGLFTVQLDFGGGIFTGNALWLEVSVEASDGGSELVTLSPRQLLTAAPYALYALSAPGGSGFWAGNGNNIYNLNSGQVGIGTTTPTNQLHVLSNNSDAIYGESTVSGGTGVSGKATSFEGGGFGVRGDSYGPTGGGVMGIAAMTTGINYGVYGQSQSQNGYGVYGLANSATGMNIGVRGATNSPNGWAGYFNGRSYFSDRVGIGTDSPEYLLDVAGLSLIDVVDDAGWVGTKAPNGTFNTLLTHASARPDEGYVVALDFGGTPQAGIYSDESVGYMFADVKNFRVPNPNQRGTEIWYACVEGPEAAAYIRGTGHLIKGRADIEFPNHFTAVATARGMTVQVTSHSADSKGLAVVERSINGFVVRELFSGTGTYDFDYTVMAVRQGHEDYRVVRSDSEGLPAMGN